MRQKMKHFARPRVGATPAKAAGVAAFFAALAIAGSTYADTLTDQIIADLTTKGYERIEIERSASRTKVEAIRGTQKLEQVFDRKTGALLKQELEAVDGDDDTRPGIEIEDETLDDDRDDDYDDHDRDDDDDYDDDDHDSDHDDDDDDDDDDDEDDDDHDSDDDDDDRDD